jgi:hypothetical protein
VRSPQIDVFLSLKLLTIEVAMITGHSADALEQLRKIERWLLSNQQSNADAAVVRTVDYWQWQVKMHIINAHLRTRNWGLALTALKRVTKELLQQHRAQQERSEAKRDVCRALVLLITRTARTAMQIGDVSSGKAYLAHARRLLVTHETEMASAGLEINTTGAEGSNRSADADAELRGQLALCEALLAFTENEVSG